MSSELLDAITEYLRDQDDADAAMLLMLISAETQGTRISMRYQVFAVADENCNSVGERLSYFDELDGAKYFAANSSLVARLHFGSAILDSATGEYDFGFGFGVPVPVPEVADNE